MDNYRSKNPNIIALRAIMKHPKLSGVIKDAFDSPVGSTSRVNAKRILSVIQKSGNDGAGGPGVTFPVQNMQLKPHTNNYSNMVIMHATPKPKIPLGKKKQPVMDGAGGLGDFFNDPVLGSQTNIGNIVSSYNPSSPLSQVGTQMKTTTAQTNKFTLPSAPSVTTSPVATAYPNLSSATPTAAQTMPNYGTTSSQIYTGGISTPSTSTSFPSLNTPITQAPPNQSPTQPPQGNQAPTNNNPSIPNAPSAPDTSTDPYSAYQTIYPGVVDAVKNGMGATMFAYDALGKGSSYLKTLPGFQNIPDSVLNGPATLSQRIANLSDALRSSYHLDDLMGQFNSLVSQGGVDGALLQSRLEDYVRGRDEFLNQTNSMIDTFKDKMVSMDMSDPNNQQGAKQYLNYLYELRGRQNQRYIGMVNTSVSVFKARLESTTQMYNTALTGYQTELQSKSTVTTEEYQRMFGALTDMYNTVAGAPAAALSMQKQQMDIWKTWVDGVKEYTSATQTGSLYSDDYKTLKNIGAISDTGAWQPNDYSLAAVKDTTNFAPIMLDAAGRALTQKNKDGVPPTLSEMVNIVTNVIGQTQNLVNSGDLKDGTAVVNDILGKFQSALTSNGQLGQSSGADIRKAVDYLANKDTEWWNPFSSGDAPSREDFITAMKEDGVTLPQDFLDTIYTDFASGYSTNRSQFATDMLNTWGYPPQSYSDQQLVNNLIESYTGKLSNFNSVRGDTQGASGMTRPQRNNNPLNIKSSTATSTYSGVVGLDPIPATDGGQFLVFNSPESGFAAAKRLLQTSGYSNLTVDQALKRWSGGGYGGEIYPALANKTISSLTDSQISDLIQVMAKREGYYNTA